MLTLKKSASQLVAEANARIKTLTLAEAGAKLGDPATLFVDIRDARELDREGTIPGAFHAPRGMLEFWVDPDSPYYREALGTAESLLLFCQSSWRSALAVAALEDMGLEAVAHIEGGYQAWKAPGGETVSREDNRRRRPRQ